MIGLAAPGGHPCASARVSHVISVIALAALFNFLAQDSAGAAGALAWQKADGYRFANVKAEGTGRIGFTRISSAQSGLVFTNRLSDFESIRNRILENGSGVAAGDFDGDGLCDLYFCRLEGPNVLYRNLGGWRFEDVTQKAGVSCPGQFSTSAAFADIDGDGDLDLLVGSVGGGVRCFINVGGGKFEERLDSGLSRTNGTMTLALADVDLDGDLDLYVANYRAQTVKDFPVDLSRLKLADGRWQLTPELGDRFVSALDATGHPILHENGEADALYLNDGQGHFAALSWTNGAFLDEQGGPLARPPLDWSLSAMFRDINGDRLPDLYVCSDFIQPDRFWVNLGNGRFRAIARNALTKTSRLSMGVDFGDLNRDGHDDFFVVDMLSPDRVLRLRQRNNLTPAMWSDFARRQRPQFMRNTLFMNRGDGSFAEIAQLSGVQATDWSWSPIFLDVDLDGYEDILVVNGSLRDAQDSDAQDEIERSPLERFPIRHKNARRLGLPPLNTPNYLFHNRGDFRFEEVGRQWGFAATNICVGMALADLDNDGDLDVIVNTLNSECQIFRNDAPGKRIEVRLRGAGANTHGIGARVRVRQGSFVQEQEIICGGRYLSSDDAARTFAADDAKGRLAIEVVWPSGEVSRVADAVANRIYEIFEPANQPAVRPASPPPGASPFFEDAGAFLKHRHQESTFDDGARQPLLARQLSRLGPGIAAVDLDGDGWEDLVIGNGAGHLPDVFLNRQGERFEQLNLDLPKSMFAGDQMAWVADRDSDGSAELLCALSSYENPRAVTNAVLRFRFDGQKLVPLEPIRGWGDSVGPLCVADFDHDGHLDLFAGGRVKPGRYPEPASSKLFLKKNGRFVEDETNAGRFSRIGLVSGAACGDLDGDGWSDLILACEWGPLRVFSNRGGELIEETERFGLAKLTGWWNAVAVADLNDDGRPDIIAANWGRNTKYQVYLEHPVGIYFGEFDGNAPFFQCETYFDPDLKKEVPWWDRDSLAGLLPSLPERFPTYTAYGRAGMAEILGDNSAGLKRCEAATLDTMVFLNLGDRFEPMALPLEAQLSPCFGIAIADFDGDGKQDIFLNQNFSGTELETSPYNDGVGVLLRGDGKGGFTAVPPRDSGILLPGDGRGCVALDWNHDGRPDLIATQNNGATHLLTNRKGRLPP